MVQVSKQKANEKYEAKMKIVNNINYARLSCNTLSIDVEMVIWTTNKLFRAKMDRCV